MLTSTLVAASLALLLQTAPATVDPAVTSDTATQLPAVEIEAVVEEEEEEEPRVICRMETFVGTRMPQRVCMTREHREQRTRDSRALAQRLDVQNSNRGRVYAPGSRGGE